MTQEEIKYLYERCTSGKATIEEQRLFEDYQDDFIFPEEYWLPEMGDENLIKAKLAKKLDQQLTTGKRALNKKVYWATTIAAACILIAFIIFNKVNPNLSYHIKQDMVKTSKADIVPGSNKAILTLSDGSTVDLDDSKNGLVIQQNSVTINKSTKGKVIYNSDVKNEDTNTDKRNLQNIITIPRGGQYQLVLEDGTKVWLNSASTLKFPVIFKGNERVVELSGEGYFEVAKNKKMPFKVLTKSMTVEVLGTHFNISAYGDDAELRTTLLEGSVKLSNSQHTALLKPGEQATLGHQKSFDIQAVNVTDAISWKNGYFIFANESIRDAMKKISRWYDVDVVFENSVSHKKLGGTISRLDNITDLLNTIKLTGGVNFKIEGRRITVMP